MPARKHYRETMEPADAEALIRAGLHYRKTLLAGTRNLRPSAQACKILHDAIESLDRTLEGVSGRALDYRATDLGLLAPPRDAKPWEMP